MPMSLAYELILFHKLIHRLIV